MSSRDAGRAMDGRKVGTLSLAAMDGDSPVQLRDYSVRHMGVPPRRIKHTVQGMCDQSAPRPGSRQRLHDRPEAPAVLAEALLQHPRPVYRPDERAMVQLWRAWHHDASGVGSRSGSLLSVHGHSPWLGPRARDRAHARPERQRQGVRARESSTDLTPREPVQQTYKRLQCSRPREANSGPANCGVWSSHVLRFNRLQAQRELFDRFYCGRKQTMEAPKPSLPDCDIRWTHIHAQRISLRSGERTRRVQHTGPVARRLERPTIWI
jgi:hypothetical protein